MFLQRGARVVRGQGQLYRRLGQAIDSKVRGAQPRFARGFHATNSLKIVKPVVLADIGEGIVECEIIQWFVEPEARVEEFSPLCEVQSDKASVEITSRFAGVVKKLHYEAGDMAKVGKPFVDIDIQGDAKQEDLEKLTVSEPENIQDSITSEPLNKESFSTPPEDKAVQSEIPAVNTSNLDQARPKGKAAALATPAVRHLTKEHNIDILEIDGTGKDGRVLKEDIFKFIQARDSSPPAPTSTFTARPADSATQVETAVELTKTQAQMFKTMTRSLTIPHFLYADEVDFTSLVDLRQRLNKVLSSDPMAQGTEVSKLSYLPFIIKAVSLALYQFPILNARVDLDSNDSSAKPRLVMRSQHNIGVAMDTPSGLIVPVIKNVGSLNVLAIAAELGRLQGLASAGRLTPADLSGGTITVSNIGNIGGTYLSPVIVEREVAILGIGRLRTVPAFDDQDRVVKRHVCNFSWSADHRVVDGATMARAADVVRKVVEEPDVMVMHLR